MTCFKLTLLTLPVIVLLLILSLLYGCLASDERKPHIIFILADDLGWNDVGFHGSSQIPTPNIDALAYGGLLLQNYYVTPICTPSRSALMTGKHPIHTGMQHTVLYAAEPRGLPLNERILPQYLQDLGYSTHIVGKWHLGHYRREYTPLYRGFESHIGFWTGHHDYYDHTAFEKGLYGYDMRRGMDIARDLHGQYTTDIISRESVRLVEKHDTSKPLFLYVAHAAVHSSNPYSPLPAPDEVVAKFSNIEDYQRRRFAAVLSKMDDSVGELMEALGRKNMLKDSVIIFSTDNGGPAAGFNINAASNWPLRGVKNTLFEGGVRGAGLIWSPRLLKSQRISKQMMHITDWLPTLVTAAGGNATLPKTLDGRDLWKSLSEDEPSPRNQILHNIDDIYGNAAVSDGKWKLLKGTNYNGEWDGWFGPSGRKGSYDIGGVLNSKTGRELRRLSAAPSVEKIRELRSAATVSCGTSSASLANHTNCNLLHAPCLFDVEKDPCEVDNLFNSNPDIAKKMLALLDHYNNTVVQPTNLAEDPRGDPRFWDHTWTNFGDRSVFGNFIQ